MGQVETPNAGEDACKDLHVDNLPLRCGIQFRRAGKILIMLLITYVVLIAVLLMALVSNAAPSRHRDPQIVAPSAMPADQPHIIEVRWSPGDFAQEQVIIAGGVASRSIQLEASYRVLAPHTTQLQAGFCIDSSKRGAGSQGCERDEDGQLRGSHLSAAPRGLE